MHFNNSLTQRVAKTEM